MNTNYKILDEQQDHHIPISIDQPLLKSHALMQNEYSQNHIIHLYFYRTNQIKQRLFHFSTIVTFGFLYLLSNWSIDIYIKFNLDPSDVSQAQYVHIIDPKFTNSLQTLTNSPSGLITFSYQYMKFYYEDSTRKFIMFKEQFEKLKNKEIHELIEKAQEQNDRFFKFGYNQLEVSLKSPMKIVVDEIINPFNIFQVFSCIIWFLHHYEYYAIAIMVITTITVIYDLHDIIENLKYLKQTLQYNGEIEKLAKKTCNTTQYVWQICQTADLLPGDIIKITNKGTVPADCLLLKGQLVVNESMLTGESVPLNKYSLPHNNSQFQKHSQNMLYYGCQIVKIQNQTDNIALVYQTGFRTQKGQLARIILFTQDKRLSFFQDSLKLIKINFVMVCIGLLVSLPVLIKYQNTCYEILLCSLDLFTVSIPPQLPVALSIGIQYSIERVRKKGMISLKHQKMNTAGEIQTAAFDKTGTLTENKLNVKGVLLTSFRNSQYTIQQTLRNYQQINAKSQLVLKHCHTIIEINTKLQGDELEISILGFIFNTENEQHLKTMFNKQQQDIKIIKIIEFDSTNQYMAVIIEHNNTNILLIKGSPEKLLSLSKKEQQPSNFQTVCDFYCNKGYRLLAFGSKVIENNNDMDITNISLEGLLVFENKLKQNTIQTIKNIKNADIEVCMITGDHLLTAVQVAKDSQILDSDQHVSNLDYKNRQVLINNQIVEDHQQLKQLINDVESGKVQLSMTGCLVANIQTLQHSHLLKQLVQQTKVFARTSPQQKQDIIEILQSNIKKENVVCMVGDGANDCQALKKADIGLSLTDSEASLACDFYSKSIKDISCLEQLIIEGKTCLTTSISSFKFMNLYSILQFIGVCTLYQFSNDFSDPMYYYGDIWILSLLVYTMNGTLPNDELKADKPNIKLTSFEIMFDLLSQYAINLFFQYINMKVLFNQPWPILKAKFGLETDKSPKPYTSSVFIMYAFQIIASSITAHKGIPFRKPFFTNYEFILALSIVMVIQFLLVLGNDLTSGIQQFMKLYQFDDYSYRYELVGIVAINISILFLFNLVITPALVKLHNRSVHQTIPQIHQQHHLSNHHI